MEVFVLFMKRKNKELMVKNHNVIKSNPTVKDVKCKLVTNQGYVTITIR